MSAERFDESIELAYRRRAAAAALHRDTNARSAAKSNAGRAANAEEDLGESTQNLKAELAIVSRAHIAAQDTLNGVFARIRSGQDVDVGTIQRVVTPLVESICRNEDALSWLARMKRKDDYVYDHSIASAAWAMVFAKHLQLDKAEIETIGLGAMLMDVGKTRIPTALLTKTEGLSPDEMKIMRRHVEFGVAVCKKARLSPGVIEIVQSHHERYNGTGYPQALHGNSIPVYARIAGIVDSYDAMTTPRPYAAPSSTADAMRALNELAGVEFQSEMVEQFVQAVGVFPVGTLVELSSGEAAVVIAQNRVRRLRPRVMILTDADKNLLEHFTVLDLRNQLVDGDGESLWITRGLPSDALELDPAELFI